MAPRKPPSRLVKTTHGKGSAARARATKAEHEAPFKAKYARNEGRRTRDDEDFDAAVRRGLGLE